MGDQMRIPFWESGRIVGSPLPLLDWNLRLSGKSRNNLWRSMACEQNLEPQRVRSAGSLPDHIFRIGYYLLFWFRVQ